MEADSWIRLFSASSKRHQSSQQSRYDLCMGFEEIDGSGGDEESRAEFSCPFCAEDFDIVGLCCHIDDEHPVEAKNGICPICAARVGMDLIGHITMQHGNFFKTQRRRRFRRGSSASHSTLSQLSLLRKELREANLHALIGGLSQSAFPSTAPDPLLSSLVYTLPKADSLRDIQPESSDEGNIASKCSEVKAVERVVEGAGLQHGKTGLLDKCIGSPNQSSKPFLSEKEQEERARRSEFVQGLVLSTIFEEIL